MEINEETQCKRNPEIDDIEVGDGVKDLVTGKTYLVCHDYEEPTPGRLVSDYEDEDEDEYDEDDCDCDGEEHGFFLLDLADANQVCRLHRTGVTPAIKAFFVNGLKHDFKRIPAEKLCLTINK